MSPSCGLSEERCWLKCGWCCDVYLECFLMGIEVSKVRVVVVFVCAMKCRMCVVLLLYCVCCFGVSRTCKIPYRMLGI